MTDRERTALKAGLFATTHRAAASLPSGDILLACFTIFIFYASLYPFDFTGSAVTLERFQRLTVLGVARSSRGDIAGNVLLFVPFGFLAVAALKDRLARPVKRVLALLAATLAVAIVTQAAQLFLPTRDASAEDIVFNTVGAALGGGLGFRWGHTIDRIKVDSLTTPQCIFSLLWIATLLLPLMPSLDYSALRAALSGLVRPGPFYPGQAIPYITGWLVLAELLNDNRRRYVAIAIAVMAFAPLAVVRLDWLFLLAPAAALAIAILGHKIPMRARAVALMVLIAASVVIIHADSAFMEQVSKLPWMNVLSGTVFFVAALIYFAAQQWRAMQSVQQGVAAARQTRLVPSGQRRPAAATARGTPVGWASVPIGLRSDQVTYLSNVAIQNGQSLSGATRHAISEFIKHLPQESDDTQAQKKEVAVLASLGEGTGTRHEPGNDEHQHVVNLPDDHIVFLGALSARLGTTISRTVQMIVDEFIEERLVSRSTGA